MEKSGKPLAQKIHNLMRRLQKNEILFIRNTIPENLVPWESLQLEDGRLLSDVFSIAHVLTLAKIRDIEEMPEQNRYRTLQVAGSGKSESKMEIGAEPMRHFSKILKNTSFTEGQNFQWWTQECSNEMLEAKRIRFFLHSAETYSSPQNSRLILHEGEGDPNAFNQNLTFTNIVISPFNGVECVELFACEASGMGQDYTEIGYTEEPEGISTAFIYSGVERILSSRYPVPFLPTSLIMERFALEIEKTGSEIKGLSNARSWYVRSLFADGFCEKWLQEHLMNILIQHQGDIDFFRKEERLERIQNEALMECIFALRCEMYQEFGLALPENKIHLDHAKEMLSGFGKPSTSQKRHHRIAQGMKE
ncbi:CHAT domain-containing protein [Desulfobacterales bacterium HSG16]|nr:CHAT domain-containing protein [Desulfobacterales bacterium HSG16]